MRTLKITAKCTDRCWVEFQDTESEIGKERSGYVPRNIGIGGGDNVELTINIDTGKIIGWQPIDTDDIIESLETKY
jgi:hypothetical protein